MMEHRKPFSNNHLHQRRARDSNPQPVSRHLISSQAANHSLTLRGSSTPLNTNLRLAARLAEGSIYFDDRLDDSSKGAVGAKHAGVRLPVKDSLGRPCYEVWSSRADWCEKRGRVHAGLRRNSECNDLPRDSSRARAKFSNHGSSGFRADSR